MTTTDAIHLRFRIDCATRWGQQVAVCGDLAELGQWRPERALPMFCMGPGRWDLNLTLSREAASKGFHYKYLLLEDGSPVQAPLWEGGPARRFSPGVGLCPGQGIELRDGWHPPGSFQDLTAASVFTRVLFPRPRHRRQTPDLPLPPVENGGRLVHFRLAAGCIPPPYRLCIVGEPTELGSWREGAALPMSDGDPPWWTLTVGLPPGVTDVEYKYGLWDIRAERLVVWETGPNRHLVFEPQGRAVNTLIRTEEAFRDPRSPYRGAGVALPLFSLRSRTGLGVGEFPDLKLLVDWACRAGLEMIQLLPLCDTAITGTWTDSYPYRAVSVFALHPIYLGLGALAQRLPAEISATLKTQSEALNALATVDYEAVMALKLGFIHRIFAHAKAAFFADAAFQAFFDQNAFWLKPYACFCLLRDRFGTADWQTWPAAFQDATAQVDALTGTGGPTADALGEIYFTQYHLHRQLADAVAYARERGVALKGDIPIGVGPHSADTWWAPQRFRMDRQAGAPPDDFSANGQNWSMPTYNWSHMAADGHRWWQARIRQMATYFDAVRIDHILGFFRIWEIPTDMGQGLMGRFNPALPLSGAELAARGIPVSAEAGRYCRPYLRRRLLEERFGPFAEAIIAACCVATGPGIYTLKPAAATQAKLLRLPLPPSVTAAGDAAALDIRRELLKLCTEVLFLPDPEKADHFHPRINLHKTDSYRCLDHAVRERIWRVYLDFFYRRHEHLWKIHGLERLTAVCEAANMLICGEDLGMVPDCVPAVMDQLGILSLKVQRMPTRQGIEVNQPADYPYASVCTTATHDMAPLREWWEVQTDDELRREICTHLPGWQTAPPGEASPTLCEALIRQHLEAPSMWAIFPLQDLLAMDDGLRHPDPYAERINIPSDPDHYWRYRLHLGLESLLAADEFNDRLASMIARSGRGRQVLQRH